MEDGNIKKSTQIIHYMLIKEEKKYMLSHIGVLCCKQRKRILAPLSRDRIYIKDIGSSQNPQEGQRTRLGMEPGIRPQISAWCLMKASVGAHSIRLLTPHTRATACYPWTRQLCRSLCFLPWSFVFRSWHSSQGDL